MITGHAGSSSQLTMQAGSSVPWCEPSTTLPHVPTWSVESTLEAAEAAASCCMPPVPPTRGQTGETARKKMLCTRTLVGQKDHVPQSSLKCANNVNHVVCTKFC